MVERFAGRRHCGFSYRKRNALDDVVKNAVPAARYEASVTLDRPPCKTDPWSIIKVWRACSIMTILLTPDHSSRETSRVIVRDCQSHVGAVWRWYRLCLQETQIIIHDSGIPVRNSRLTVVFPT